MRKSSYSTFEKLHMTSSLDYPEDSDCDTDMNVVMTGRGGIVEIQGTAEGEPFTRAQMGLLVDLAEAGIGELIARQKATVAA